MAYCALSNIEDAIPALRGRWGQGTPASPSAADVADWIAESDDEIDGYLARIKPSGETLPLAVVPPRIRRISVDLTAARILEFTLAQGSDRALALAKQWHDRAIKALEEIVAGSWEDLFPSDAETTSALPSTLSTGLRDERTFTWEGDQW